MSFFRSERGIGRGETAESRIEAPIFAVFMLFASLALFAQHLVFANISVTTALTISHFPYSVCISVYDLVPVSGKNNSSYFFCVLVVCESLYCFNVVYSPIRLLCVVSRSS